MAISLAEVRDLLIQALPSGSSDFYDLETPEAKISRLFTALSQMVKKYGFDTVDQLFLEVNPFTIVQDIPDWEIAAGLIGTRTALLGSTDQRRNQIIGTLRGSGSFSLEDFRSAIEPFYKYQLAQRIRIVEPNRDNLRSLHSYGFHDSGSIMVTMASPVTLTFDLTYVDDFITTDTGVILSFDYDGLNLSEAGIIVAPTSFFVERIIYGPGYFPPLVTINYVPIKLYLKQYANLPSALFPMGRVWEKWTVEFSSSGATYYVRNPTLFVEGMGRATPPKIGEGLSSSMFFWNPLAETTLLGANPDIQGADLLLKKIKPAHTTVNSGYFEEKVVLIDYPNNTGDTSDFLSVWGTATSDIFISTEDGNILRFDGSVWFLDTDLAAGYNMTCINGTSLQNIFAVGQAGELLIEYGLGWSDNSFATVEDLKGVVAFDDKSAIAVGTNGSIFSISNKRVATALTSPTAEQLNAIYTSNLAEKVDIWAVGTNGAIIRSTDGVSFTNVTSPTADELMSISGDGPNNIYAVGVNGTVIHWDGISWTSQTLAGGYTLNTVAMSFEDLDDVWIGAQGGHVFHKGPYDSAFTEADVTSTTEGLFGSWLKSSNVMWMVGGNGTIIRYSPLAIFPDNVRALPDACFPS